MSSRILISLFILIFMVGTGSGEAVVLSSPSAPSEETTDAFVDFYLYDVPGKAVRLSSLKEGKSALLVFWAMWSTESRKLLDELQQRLADYQDQNIVVLAINVDRNPKRLSLFVDQHQYKFSVLKDPQGIFEDHYDVYLLPTNILIDKENRLVYRGHRLPRPGDVASEKA